MTRLHCTAYFKIIILAVCTLCRLREGIYSCENFLHEANIP